MSPSNVPELAQAMAINWRDEVKKMFDEELLRGSAYGADRQEKCQRLAELIVKFLVEHVDGCLQKELRDRFEGVCRGLGIASSTVYPVLDELVTKGKLILVDEEVEWPENSGWVSTLRRVRVSPETWVEAVS